MKLSTFAFVLSRRTQMLFLVHLLVFCLAYLAAILLRFDFAVSPEEWSPWVKSLPWYLAVKMWIFYCLGSFQGWWRYVTFADLAGLLKAATVSTLCIVAIDYFVVEQYQVPRGILLLDLVTTILFFGASRASIRLVRELFWPMVNQKTARRALIVGAGEQGEAIARQINATPRTGYRAVGFLDHDAANHGTWLGGIPILGDPSDVRRLASRSSARDILVAGDSLPGRQMRNLVENCRGAGLSLRMVPRVADIITGRYEFQVREVDINDLLRRDPVQLDVGAIAQFIQGRRVMITGAGGSIGSEICRQIIRFHPEAMLFVERFESGLFFIHRELEAVDPAIACHPCLADILDHDRMEALFKRHRPNVVFHCAAHKHVPMLEYNPSEAIKNNVVGTKCVADLAQRHGVAHFVLISTDKAVNPTSVMGVSKQLAERCVHALANTSATTFVTVRFGNVLGSNGSVVPIFQEQIRRGGPVTVTHPDMRRYFMTIPEASQLVLQAAAMGKGGEIFVLDMGQPIKIVNLVHDMIRLSGAKPENIAIEYIGIRPGEKLSEELQYDDEQLLPTSHPKVKMAYHRPCDGDGTLGFITALQRVVGSREMLSKKLRDLVPEYQPTRELAGSDFILADADVPSIVEAKVS